jgi:hypothetical protein
LSPWLFLVLVGSPLSILPSILGRQEYELIFKIILMVGRTFLLFIGALKQDIFLSIGLFSCYSTICILVYMNWTLSISGNIPTKLIFKVVREIPKAILLLAPVILAKYYSLYSSKKILFFLLICISMLLIVIRVSKLIRNTR